VFEFFIYRKRGKINFFVFFEKKHEKTRACPDIHKRIRYIYAVFNKERIEIQYWSKFSAPVSE
jgi:hypothetical protein